MKARSASHTRSFLFSGSAAAAMTMALAAPAMAQDQIDDSGVATEEIFVTGSLIARDPNAGAPVPVQSISGEDLKMAGTGDIVEVLRDIPALSTSISSQGSIDSVFDGADASVGGSFLQLRGLGLERTLVLVDGRRHVSGLADEQAVDMGSIPQAMIERVEVLTGGASSLYGADAVSGVVNVILKEDFEGLQLDARAGLSGQGDGEEYRISGLLGHNFGGGRGNITVNAFYSRQQDIRGGDRDFSRNSGIQRVMSNPDLVFQANEISAASTPNFAQLFARGDGIPTSAAAFSSAFQDATGNTPSLTAAEQALIDRASTAPQSAFRPDVTFAISSDRGVIGLNSGADLDLDGNGIPDCDQTVVSGVGACWVVNDDGSVRPYQDGEVSGSLVEQSGGDGISTFFDDEYLIPDRLEYGAQVNLRYDFTNSVTGFLEGKYVRNRVLFGGPYTIFHDEIPIAADNPFIPAAFGDAASEGLFVFRDHVDLSPNDERNTRETFRIVGGVEGEFDNGWAYELSGNYGRFEQTSVDVDRAYGDRYFAAVDAVRDPDTGNIVCRSDLDPNTVSPTSPFPEFSFGYYSFTPGDGQCAPLNILGGPNAATDAARNFITTDTTTRFELEQLSFRALLTGDTGDFLELPAGPIGFAIGAEYREEKSTSTFDDLELGILPQDGIIPGAGGEGGNLIVPAGSLIRDVPIDGFVNNQLVIDATVLENNTGGQYDVWDLFMEVSIPLISGKPFAEELSVGGAIRYSDYSTIGSATTWSVNGTWQPIESLRFRASYAKAVRAPNIFELFSPEVGETFDTDRFDPCNQASIDSLIASDAAAGARRAANCAADGIPAGFVNPATGRFVGVEGGNPDLSEETAKTYTIGAVFQPTWFDGFTLSLDYYNIEIENAISQVNDRDIVDNCYDSTSLDNQFCTAFTRNRDPNSSTFLSFNFLRQSQLNFGSLKTSGVDIAAQYQFAVGEIDFSVRTTAAYVSELDEFFDPSDPTNVDPELGELQRPQWAGGINVSANYNDFQFGYNLTYIGQTALRDVEIETREATFGDAGFAGRAYIHDINASYRINETLTLYGGVNNLADRQPFITEQAYPVSPIGRQFFLGVTADVF